MPRTSEPKVTPERVANAVLIAFREGGFCLSRKGIAHELGVKVTPYLIGAIEAAIQKGWIIAEVEVLRNSVRRWLYVPQISKPVRRR